MRVALAHDYLNQYGGAERVLEALADAFPEAPIYTLLYDEAATFGRFRGRVKKTSFLDCSFVRNHHRLFIPLFPIAASIMRIGGCDLVVSSTAGYAKGMRTGKARHVAYCHTPLRYAWEPEYVVSKFSAGDMRQRPIRLRRKSSSGGETRNSELARALTRACITPVLTYLRIWDYYAGQKPDALLANSQFIAEKIKICYGRAARVVYPPVDLSVFRPDPSIPRGEYYLAAGRLLHYKRFDLAIDAFNTLGLPLVVAGSGPELEALKRRAQPNIRFLPFTGDAAALRALYCGAKALIFPQVEDFGLVAAEAIACGTPVIAYDAGGVREIVRHGENGALFARQEKDDLYRTVIDFDVRKFLPEKVARTAERFSKEEFIKTMREVAVETAHSLVNSPAR